MKMSLLRKCSIAIVSLTLFSMSSAFCAMDMDSRVTQLENQMQQVRTETAVGTCGARTALARPEVCGHGWFVIANVLLWHPKIGGSDFAFRDQDINGSQPIIGEVKDVGFDWSWGFRFGLGYNFEHDGWDLRVIYTYFNPDDSESALAGDNQSVMPLVGAANIGNLASDDPTYRVASSAKCQFDIKYQTIDLSLGRDYFVSKCLSFRPHWGLKTAWIDLERIVRYSGTPSCPTNNETADSGLGCDRVQVRDDSDFWGLGPRAGVHSRWHLGRGVSIFGNISAALLYGFFDVKHRDQVSPLDDINTVKLKGDRHSLIPTLQLYLGLRYDDYLNNNKQHIGIGLGYEVNYWWRVNQMLRSSDFEAVRYNRYSEDLSLFGLTLDLRLDF